MTTKTPIKETAHNTEEGLTNSVPIVVSNRQNTANYMSLSELVTLRLLSFHFSCGVLFSTYIFVFRCDAYDTSSYHMN